ncbi:MAG: hypothetical protein NT154_12860, partial [Verrucomicrobia bacterium]|nr:hypothetical protein [Verrucomicrobiota bacterium]
MRMLRIPVVGWLLATPLLASLTLSPTSLTFTGYANRPAPATKTFSVASNLLAEGFTVQIASGNSWLSASPTSGTAGAKGGATITVTANSAVLNTPGTYTGSISVVASSGTKTVTVTFEVLQPKPDLWIQSGAKVTPSEVRPGAQVQVSAWVVNNAGNAAGGPFTVGYYLSTDSVITAADVSLGSIYYGYSLSAGASTNPVGPANLTIPAATAPGTYWVGTLVDSTNAVSELNEANNSIATQIAIGWPDLVVMKLDALTATPTTVMAGTVIQIPGWWRVQNQGTTTAAASTTGLYLSTDSTITTSDVYLGRYSCDSLPPRYVYDWGTPSWTVPPSTPPGTYYVGILADIEDSVAESNEFNNYLVSSAKITVTAAKPDLVISSPPAGVSPTSLTAGGTMRVALWTVKNQGTSASGTFRIEYRMDGEPESGIPGVYETWPGPTLSLAAGQSIEVAPTDLPV